MSKINDGAPAFPFEFIDDDRTKVHPGMSLRDWFAGHALGGFISRCATDDDWRRLPAVVYEMADAMLSARSNRGEEDNG